MITLTLGRRTFSVEATCSVGMSLRGPRGARYTLVQNQPRPRLWCLIPSRSPTKTTWFVRAEDGSFEACAR